MHIRALFFGAFVGHTFANGNITYSGNCTRPDGTAVDFLDKFDDIYSQGTVEFSLQPPATESGPWYYFITLEKSENSTDNDVPTLHQWLGFPESIVSHNDTKGMHLCKYTLTENFNSTIHYADSAKTCDGVLSDKCQDAAWHTFAGFGACPRIDFKEYCPSYLPTAGKVLLFTKQDTCFASGLPGLDLPGGYVVASIGSTEVNDINNIGDRGSRDAAYEAARTGGRPTFLSFFSNHGPDSSPLVVKTICTSPHKLKNEESNAISGRDSKLRLSLPVAAGAAVMLLL